MKDILEQLRERLAPLIAKEAKLASETAENKAAIKIISDAIEYIQGHEIPAAIETEKAIEQQPLPGLVSAPPSLGLFDNNSLSKQEFNELKLYDAIKYILLKYPDGLETGKLVLEMTRAGKVFRGKYSKIVLNEVLRKGTDTFKKKDKNWVLIKKN